MKVRFWSILCLGLWLPVSGLAQDVQRGLREVAGDIQRIEGRLQALEARLDDLRVHGAELEEDYAAQQDKFATTISAFARMQRVPKAAVLTRPGGALQAARTHLILRSALPAIEQDSQALHTLWVALNENRNTLEAHTFEARAAKEALSAAHDSLSEALQAKGQVQVDASQVESLAQNARDLRDLLTRLQDEQMDGIQFIPQGEVSAQTQESGVMPVSGVVRLGFGAKDETGEKVQGVHINTLEGALVVAPLEGVVRYAGAFKGHGMIVIIAHKEGYHSLLANLEKINVDVGQKLGAGEPVGLVQGAKGGQTHSGLYFELRLHGQAVNPARKIADLELIT